MFSKNLSIMMIIGGTLFVAMPRLAQTQQKKMRRCILCGHTPEARETFGGGYVDCKVDRHVTRRSTELYIIRPIEEQCPPKPSPNLLGIVKEVARKIFPSADYSKNFETQLTSEEDTKCFQKIYNSSFAIAGCATHDLFDCLTYITGFKAKTPPKAGFHNHCLGITDIKRSATYIKGNATDFINTTESEASATHSSVRGRENFGNGIKRIGFLAYLLLFRRIIVN